MAKKKKGARPGSSKGARKAASGGPRKSGSKAKSRARAPRRAAAGAPSGVHPGLSESGKVDLRFLNADIDEHIARLRGMGDSPRVTEALKALEGARAQIKFGCAPTMVIP